MIFGLILQSFRLVFQPIPDGMDDAVELRQKFQGGTEYHPTIPDSCARKAFKSRQAVEIKIRKGFFL